MEENWYRNTVDTCSLQKKIPTQTKCNNIMYMLSYCCNKIRNTNVIFVSSLRLSYIISVTDVQNLFSFVLKSFTWNT